MALIHKVIREFVWMLSELEARCSRPNDALHFRQLYFRLQKVKHGRVLWVGKSFHLLNSGNLVLGKRCALGEFTRIDNHGLISIGDDFTAAPGLCLNSGTHEPNTLQPKTLPICIGNRVWCGINTTILAGVTIGDDVVLGAGSVVCKDIPSNSIAVGVPAKVIKSLNRDSSKSLWTWVCQSNEQDIETPSL